jgi:hypothetical protein
MKIELTRHLTIPTEKFSPVKVEVSLSKEFDENFVTYKEEYEKLSTQLDATLALEILSILEEQKDILKNGYETYLRLLESQKEKIENNL